MARHGQLVTLSQLPLKVREQLAGKNLSIIIYCESLPPK